ncbi:hypothetical protein [Sphingomonas sp. LT1P40]|uniref:hypothetical protein n=1 Tax=Alteristakelama amylovorans TaxID=3096166 RepID=UPI002FCB39D3
MSGSAWAKRMGERAAARVRARVAVALRERFGDAVREDADGVVIEARGVARRWLSDPALRWIAGLIR